MRTLPDYYEILEVHPSASPEVIARAYRVLVSRFHPDTHPPERRAWAEERMKVVNEAYSVLSDHNKRDAYDRERSAVSQADARAIPTAIDSLACAFHPSARRISICFECRKNLCPECRVIYGGKPYCKACGTDRMIADHVSMEEVRPVSRRAKRPRPLFDRFSIWGLAVAATATLALMPWLYSVLAPVIVVDLATQILAGAAAFVVSLICVYCFAGAMSALRWGMGFPWRIAAICVFVVVLGLGIQDVQFVTLRVHERIERTKAIREEESAYRDFVEAWKALAPPVPWLEGLVKGRTQFDSYVDLEIAPEQTGENPKLVPPSESFAQSGSQARLREGVRKAQRYLKVPLSYTKPRRRADCQHFVVWAQLYTHSETDVSGYALDCLKITSDPAAVADCAFYLASKRLCTELVKSKLKEADQLLTQVKLPQKVRLVRVLIALKDPRAPRLGLQVLAETGDTRYAYGLAEDLCQIIEPGSELFGPFGDIVSQLRLVIIPGPEEERRVAPNPAADKAPRAKRAVGGATK